MPKQGFPSSDGELTWQVNQMLGGFLFMGKLGRRLLYAGLLICALSLSFPWGRGPGGWRGGYSYLPRAFGEPVIAWNASARYDPGPSYSASSPMAIGLLLAMAVWGAVKTAQARRLRRLAALAYGLLVVWWLFQITPAPGVWIFLGGVALLGASLLTPGRGRG